MKPVNVTIELCNYNKSHKNGAEFISVSYNGGNWGGASPCDTEEEVKRTIANVKERAANNKVIINDLRKNGLLDYF